MFLMTSSRFRRAARDRLVSCVRGNQIIPFHFHLKRQTTQQGTRDFL